MELLLAQAINPDETIRTLRALALGVASLALIFIGVMALFGPGRTGNNKGVALRVAASCIALIPIAIGISIGASAFGVNLLEWLIPGLA